VSERADLARHPRIAPARAPRLVFEFEVEAVPRVWVADAASAYDTSRLLDWLEARHSDALDTLLGVQWRAAVCGETAVPGGVHRGARLHDVARLGPDGRSWLRTQLRKLPDDDRMRAPIEQFVEYAIPDLYAEWLEWLDEQERAA
jgi:hypothetical protein